MTAMTKLIEYPEHIHPISVARAMICMSMNPQEIIDSILIRFDDQSICERIEVLQDLAQQIPAIPKLANTQLVEFLAGLILNPETGTVLQDAACATLDAATKRRPALKDFLRDILLPCRTPTFNRGFLKIAALLTIGKARVPDAQSPRPEPI